MIRADQKPLFPSFLGAAFSRPGSGCQFQDGGHTFHRISSHLMLLASEMFLNHRLPHNKFQPLIPASLDDEHATQFLGREA